MPPEIADLIAIAMQGPTGPEDSAWHTGVIQTWDESTQLNSVLVNGVILPNLRSVQSGIGVLYQPGDVVMIVRKQTQYFILGKVSAPGSAAQNQIQSASIGTYETTGSTTFADLATVGPTVTVNIGSSRRCLVLHGAEISCAGNPAGAYIGGAIGFQVSGASSISAAFGARVTQYSLSASTGAGFQTQTTKASLVTAADGLNSGTNTFTCKYYSQQSSPVCGFQFRSITVIPF